MVQFQARSAAPGTARARTDGRGRLGIRRIGGMAVPQRSVARHAEADSAPTPQRAQQTGQQCVRPHTPEYDKRVWLSQIRSWSSLPN
jgi:hypothetical protein